jgi:methyltransferase (TIGR00027 family)
MKENKASLTAKGIAIMRAVESMKPENERLFYDPFAEHFVSRALLKITKFIMDIGYAEKKGPGVPEYIASRVRYIDDYLAACIKDGIEQLVILGAGYDSRAYRFNELRGKVKVFEIDHPASLEDKKKRLEKYFGQIPENIIYVPIDFNTDELSKCLIGYGFDINLKTLFIWEGVTYYLASEAVDSTLEFIAKNSGAGSSVIFDYTYSWVIEGKSKRGEIVRMKRYRRFTGEGLVFGIEDGKIVEFLETRGFCKVVNANGDDFKRLYFSGTDKEVAPIYSIAYAEVYSHAGAIS